SGDPVLRAWRRLGGRYARLDLARAPHEPALHWVERVARLRPRDADALRALGRRFVRWRYGPAAGEDPRQLALDLRRHRPRCVRIEAPGTPHPLAAGAGRRVDAPAPDASPEPNA